MRMPGTGLVALLTLWQFCASSSFAGDLDDTAWRLSNITEMNDSVHVPEDPAKFTIEFKADGRVLIGADCNRGTGTWSADDYGRLRFGPIASTRAICPPGSLSERFLREFEWVRSYTLSDGRLFLATMADGSIIEFEAWSAPH